MGEENISYGKGGTLGLLWGRYSIFKVQDDVFREVDVVDLRQGSVRNTCFYE